MAIERVLGVRPPARVRMGGKTDPQIVREYLAMLEIGEAEGSDHLPVILDHLATALAAVEHVIAERGRVLPGVEAVLGRLGDDPTVLQTVLTGNLAANAVVKLAAFGLQDRLDLEIGAYGSDDADRNRLVPVALDRAADRAGPAVRPGRGVGGRRHPERPGLRPGRRGPVPAGRQRPTGLRRVGRTRS